MNHVQRTAASRAGLLALNVLAVISGLSGTRLLARSVLDADSHGGLRALSWVSAIAVIVTSLFALWITTRRLVDRE